MARGSRRMRLRRLAAAALVGLALSAGCTALPGPDSRRGPTRLGDEYHLSDGTTLDVAVQSCNGDPELAELEETETEVRIQVVATTYRDTDDCLDSIQIKLTAPVGDRAVIDVTTGNRLSAGSG